jgi:hypothetical protein
MIRTLLKSRVRRKLLRRYARCTGIRSTDLFGIADIHQKMRKTLLKVFFLHLIESKTLRRVDRSKGKFRSFLLASLSTEAKRVHRVKRGGNVEMVFSISNALKNGNADAGKRL